MRLSRVLSLSLTLIGGSSATTMLARRVRWERAHHRVAICVDFDDARAAAIRAGMPFDDLLHELARHGATHLSLPELTLHRLMRSGELTPHTPARPLKPAPRVGHWNYLHGDADLVSHLAGELAARLPHGEARAVDKHTLAFAGDVPTVGEIGLGFDTGVAQRIDAHGLETVPRPVSYAWPEPALIERTLAQAAAIGHLIAFDGSMILGHEMHLNETLGAMEREGLSLVYFAESRHQKGDWFVAKRRAPRVVLAHRFTPADMIPLDFHAAAHVWAHLVRERGIRLCYVNFFKVLHAAEPLEGLHYVEHIKQALEHDGFTVSKYVSVPLPVPAPSKRDLALAGLASAGIAVAALDAARNLPDTVAVPLGLAAAGGAAALPYLDRARSRLEDQYPPSYAPKAMALATASIAPLVTQAHTVEGWIVGWLAQVAAAAQLAAVISGQDYQLRIEEYRGFNLDWLLPLALAAASLPNRSLRAGAIAVLMGVWSLANQRGLDLLARLDPAPAEGHTHHLSAAARAVGDARLALGPQPARKWSGLGPFGSAWSMALASRGRSDLAAGAAILGALGNILGLVGFRRPERALRLTTREALPSFALGIALGSVVIALSRFR